MNSPARNAPGSGQLPRGALLGAGFLVMSSLVLVLVVRLFGISPVRPVDGIVIASHDVQFADRDDGAVLVYSAEDHSLVQTLPPGTNGFVRGVLRGLARDRRADRIGATPPFRLTRWADGRLSLDDPTTHRHVDLEVFGPTNAGAFADIFIAVERHQVGT